MNNYKALGMYIFAGGFTVGVEKYFQVLAHLEKGKFGVETSKKNFPHIPVYPDPKTWPIQDLAEQGIDFVYGNPPCAAWSTAGAKLGKTFDTHWITDERLSCHRSMFEVCFKLRPKVFTFESVSNLITSGKGFVEECVKMCHDQGYGVTVMTTDATNHGLAQRRRRVFFFAHTIQLPLEEPTPQWLTVGEVLRDIKPTHIPKLNPLQEVLLPRLKPGEKIRELFDANYPEGTVGKPSFMRRRLHPDEPSNTIATHSDYFHPYEDRLLAPNEAAALCGYPSDYKWPDSESSAYAEVGAAVLPPVGEYVALQAKNALDRDIRLVGPSLWYKSVDFLSGAEQYYKQQKKSQC